VDRAIRRNYEHIAPELKAFMDDAATPPRVPEETAALARLLERINAVTAAADKAAGEDAPSDGARQQALADMLSAYAATFDQAAARASAEGWGSRGALRQLAALVPKPEAGLVLTEALRDRRPVPLTFAVEQFDSGAEYARRRMEAYREVLPLRATMRPDDTVAVYRARALESGRRPGDGLADQGAEPGLILGDALAESAILGGVNVGDVVEVTIPRVYFVNGRPDSKATQIKFRITALFRSGLFEDNLGRMYCDFDVLTGVLADSQARYYVGARLRDYSVYEGAAAADSLKRSIQEALFRQGALASGVTLWEDEKRSLLEAVEREKMILGLIVSFIIVLAGVLILILVFQLVNEKQKDIGILKALGFSPWGIRSVFMFNALFIGLFGAILGALAGITLSEYLNEIEDFIDQWTGTRLFPPDVYFLTYIPSVKGTALVRLALDIAAPVVLFSFGCGILPAQLAARKDPVEALHYE
jgi:ABC-type lipoprotein release transport system permease subunit